LSPTVPIAYSDPAECEQELAWSSSLAVPRPVLGSPSLVRALVTIFSGAIRGTR